MIHRGVHDLPLKTHQHFLGPAIKKIIYSSNYLQLLETSSDWNKKLLCKHGNYIDVYKDINALDDAKVYLTDRLKYLNNLN